MLLSVVIPAFNEAQRLPPTLEKVCTFLEGRGDTFEVLVVDDGSRDGTAAAAQPFSARGVRVVRLEENRGKGAALKAGVMASRGDRVLLCDADLSTPIEDLARLETRLADCQLVVGSRAVDGANVTVHQPIYRELMGKVFNRIIRLLGITSLSDTQCGFKLIDGAAAKRLFAELTVERFAYDVELVWLARRHGLRMAEVGVTWENSPASRVDPLFDSVHMLQDVLRFRFRRRRR